MRIYFLLNKKKIIEKDAFEFGLHKMAVILYMLQYIMVGGSRGCFQNAYELVLDVDVRALKFSIGKIFCVEFKRCPLKFHTKYLTHTLKNMCSF